MNPTARKAVLLHAPLINWTNGSLERQMGLIQKIKNNPQDYQNLWAGHHYWQRKMTPDEKRMRSHPNRSARWIPHRIEAKRKIMRWEALSLFADKIHTDETFGPNQPCLRCELDYELQSQALAEFNDLINQNAYPAYRDETKDISWSDYEEINKARQNYKKSLESFVRQLESKYPPEITATLDTDNSPGTTQAWVSRPFGFCITCYQQVKQEAQNLINLITNG